ncbi:MAG: universal stress protein [Planctomycetaceae bacterium]|jgi:nucleotide-binding universal stress UspA family protein|nr:universal stress protein [Planctomycetaceae bacterium]
MQVRDSVIVVPLDMSDFSLTALATAAGLASDYANIRVLHVLPELARPASGDRLGQCSSAMSAFLQQRGYAKPDITVRTGEPIKQILHFAKDVDAGLIIMPSHGRGMLTEMLLGSTAYSVVRHSTCPVLVLKPTKQKEA